MSALQYLYPVWKSFYVGLFSFLVFGTNLLLEARRPIGLLIRVAFCLFVGSLQIIS